MKLGQGHFDANEQSERGGRAVRAFPCEKSSSLKFCSLVSVPCQEILHRRLGLRGSVANSQRTPIPKEQWADDVGWLLAVGSDGNGGCAFAGSPLD